jgi:hypothetical protein
MAKLPDYRDPAWENQVCRIITNARRRNNSPYTIFTADLSGKLNYDEKHCVIIARLK